MSGQGALVTKKKMLSMAEVEQLQYDLRKAEENNAKSMDVLNKVQSLSIMAIRSKDASETFVLELANTLADMGLDVGQMVDAASAAAKDKTDAPAPASDKSPANEADIAKYDALYSDYKLSVDNLSNVEAKLKAAEERASAAEKALGSVAGFPPPSTPRETQDMVAILQGKMARLESASNAMLHSANAAFGPNSSDSGLSVHLKNTQDLLQQKEAELNLKTQEWTIKIQELQEAERKATEKLQEQTAELQKAKTPKDSAPADNGMSAELISALKAQIASLEKEKAELKNEKTQLKGELDLMRADAAKAKNGSKGCEIQ